MDPLSITASIIGILTLLGKAVSTIRKFKNSDETAQHLLQELVSLHDSLAEVKGLVTSDATLFDSNTDCALRSYLIECQTLTKDIRNLDGSRSWPWEEKKYQRSLENLRAFRESVRFALDIGSCRLLARSSTEIQSILERQVELCKVLREFGSSQRELANTILDESRMIREGQEALVRQKLLDWISPGGDAKHKVAREMRVKETGKWILEDIRFQHWRDGVADDHILWCHGPQGSGKTILAYVKLCIKAYPAQVMPYPNMSRDLLLTG
jgi:hypothetical protein